MATSKLRPLIESRMARTAIEHLNETNPDYLRAMFKDNPKELKDQIEQKVMIAFDLKERYLKTGMSNDQVMELLNLYLADPEELPLEDINEISQAKISHMIKKMANLK
ncbi:hypothetical protein [Mangrovibacterium lignilyticum]|uniref:hypothetical protein n=1 Tax=Mangrovibacterium lignilyticum TaxID=2668052 RepID=UPI0013D0C3CE|nr:hypothetical protein [Mangrovibacterium lignilyticum]